MMDNLGTIELSEEQGELWDVAADFCRNKSPIDKVRSMMEEDLGHDSAVWTEIAELGWLGVAIPEDMGGIGLSLAEVVPLIEAMGRHLMQSPFFSTTLAAQVLVAGGTPVQQQQWLPQLTTGAIASVALHEKNGSWDLSRVSCSATRSGDSLALSGTKRLVADAGVADILLATVIYDAKPAIVLIEKSAIPNGALRRETIVDETRRAFEIKLDGIVIPNSSLLDLTKTEEALRHLHLVGNLLAAAEMVGCTKSTIDYTLDYLKTRKQFGKLIGSYQALKHPIVDAYAKYEQARSHVYAAAHCFNQQGTGEIATRMSKVAALDALSFAADRSIQFHGGFGFTYDCDAQLYRRRAIWHGAQFGDGSYHKKKLAELLLS